MMRSHLDRISDCIPALRRYAWALLRDPADADDLVHDCLERALSNLPAQTQQPDIRPWLFAIMHNLHISQRRKAKVRACMPIDQATEQFASTPPTQEHALHLSQVLRALDTLPEDQRVVLLLVCVEDLSYADTAVALGIPVGTVMSRLSRGREALRGLMEAQPRARLRSIK